MHEVVFSSDLFDMVKVFYLVCTCVVIGDTSLHTQSEASSMHPDMHSARNDTETAASNSRNVERVKSNE